MDGSIANVSSDADRTVLERLIKDRNAPAKVVLCADIAFSADRRLGTMVIWRGAGTTRKRLDRSLVLENSATHEMPNGKARLEKHLRSHLHFTPQPASWINLVEMFFAENRPMRIRHGMLKSVDELKIAIRDHLDHHNGNLKLFIWIRGDKYMRAKQDPAEHQLNRIKDGN